MELPSTYHELICERGTWSYSALRYSNGAIHLGRAILSDAMEMQSCSLITKIVAQLDDDSVASVGLNQRTRPLLIDSDHWPREAIRRGCHPVDSPVVGHYGRRYSPSPSQERQDARYTHYLLCEYDNGADMAYKSAHKRTNECRR